MSQQTHSNIISPRALRSSALSLKGIWIIADFEARAFINYPSTAIGRILIEPLVYTAFLAAGIQGLLSDMDISYLTFAFSGILAIQALRAFGIMIYRATVDRRWGILGLKMLSGIGSLGYILGFALVPILVFIAQVLVVTPIAILLGAELPLVNLMATIGIGVVMILFWTCLALMITTGIKNYKQRDMIISLSLLPITFSAPVFYSITSAPLYLQVISYINPLTYQVLAMRNASLGNFWSWELGVTILLGLVSVYLSVIILSRAELLSSEH